MESKYAKVLVELNQFDTLINPFEDEFDGKFDKLRAVIDGGVLDQYAMEFKHFYPACIRNVVAMYTIQYSCL